ncbi:MAG TPA: hypothetical protein VOB72_14365 [Candidatus Dormibacteraeota bacterium]|nr:hypothetical protein [Candidatus Dormibacteraeota bacterium]
MTTVTLFGLARALLLRGPLRAAALGFCVAGTVAIAWALPLTASVALRSGLREALADGAHLTVERSGVADFDGFVAFQRQAAARVEPRLTPYLAPADVFATVGPVAAASIDDQPVAAAAQLTAGYLDDLAAHVDVLAGYLPPDGLGGGPAAATMPQSGADQLGLRLSDRFCVTLAAGTPWCARLVGIWRPRHDADPYWAGRPPRLEVAVGRYDFFQLLKLRPAAGATVGRRYGANLDAAGPASADDLVRRLRDLRASFGAADPMRLTVSLDAALSRYDASQGAAAPTLDVLMAGLAVLALCLIQLTASRVVDLQSREVAALRARGWPPAAAWRFLFAQLCAVAIAALPAGLAGAALVTTALGVGAQPGTGPTAGDAAMAAVTLAAVLAGAAGVLAVVAWSLAARDAGREPSLLGPAAAWWRRWNVDLPLAALALALLLARPARSGIFVGAAGPGDILRFLAPVLAVSILGLVALRALPLVGRMASPDARGVAAALAGWQLRRRPDQHAGVVFLVVLALATGGFCALNLAIQSGAVADLDGIHHGFEAVVTAVLAAALTIGLAGVWLHFRAAARVRRLEYATLALYGLPAAAARRSVAVEQLVILSYAAVVGTLLALVLLAALAGDLSVGGFHVSSGDVVDAAVWWAALPAGLAVVSWLVRRASFRGDVAAELRRAQ